MEKRPVNWREWPSVDSRTRSERAAGPVALFRLPVRVRMAFHGTWVPAETFRTRSCGMEIAQ